MGSPKLDRDTKKDINIGDRFGRLVVTGTMQHYNKDGKKDGLSVICQCDCGNQKIILKRYLLRGMTKSCGCFKSDTGKKTIVFANEWHKQHPELRQELGRKIVETEGFKRGQAYLASHPEIILEAAKCGREAMRRDPNFESSLQKQYREFLEREGFQVEREFLLEDHYFDLKVGSFLIEINGVVYHSSQYENLLNPSSNGPCIKYLKEDYHKSLYDLARRNGYNLIQIWEYNRYDFNTSLLRFQLNGIADINDYIQVIDNHRVICNDYGFNIQGPYLPDSGRWISISGGIHKIVIDSYEKGKVLCFNSGYTILD